MPNKHKIDPKVALVTGANRGLGFEVCRQLAEQNYNVILTARNFEKAQKAADLLQEEKLRATPLQLDVTKPENVSQARDSVEKEFGRLDALINNAGIDYDTDQNAFTADLERVKNAFETNTLGPWRIVQVFIPLIRKSLHGRIVNVTSGVGMGARVRNAPGYSISKVALNVVTRMFARILEDDGILVNAISPGHVATDMGKSVGRPVADGAADIIEGIMLPDNGPTGEFFREDKCVEW